MNILPLLAFLAAGAGAQPAPEEAPIPWSFIKQQPGVPDPAPSADPGAAYVGLAVGSSADPAVRAAVLRVKRVLKAWNPRLPLTMDGSYDVDGLGAALTLFKAVYGTGADGSSIDPATASLLAAREDGTFAQALARLPNRGKKSAGGRALYAAAQRLGLPYRLGADGVTSMDCGLLTMDSLREAGVVGGDFTRAADFQYAAARRDGVRLIGFRAGESRPKPGDLVFFQWTYNPNDGVPVYEGITHVGFWVGGALEGGDAFILAASSRRGVSIQRLSTVGRPAYAFARPRDPAPVTVVADAGATEPSSRRRP